MSYPIRNNEIATERVKNESGFRSARGYGQSRWPSTIPMSTAKT